MEKIPENFKSIHTHESEGRWHVCVDIPFCLLFFHNKKNAIYMDSWLLILSFLCFFSFPFINSVLKNVSSSVFACIHHRANDAHKNESLKGKGYFCDYSSVDCLPWTLNVKFGVFDHFALFSIGGCRQTVSPSFLFM